MPDEQLPESARESEAERLIARIRRIQAEIAAENARPASEEEEAFTQAALEQQAYTGYICARRLGGRRLGG